MTLGLRKDYMSKIGNIAMELDQKAAELGFESLQQALDAGCEVEYGPAGQSELVEPLVAAHRAWEKEKEEVLKGLSDCYKHLHGFPPEIYGKIERAFKFVKEAHE